MTPTAWAVAGDGRTRTLLAVLDGHRTVRAIAAHTGFCVATTHEHLVGLRRAGLVDWVTGRQVTLHPLVRVVGREIA